MDEALAEAVRARAGWACEYCLLPAGVLPTLFELDHIVAEQHGGASVAGNLAFACLRCNKKKGPNLASIDHRTSRTKLVRLFNPRRHRWGYHFMFDGPRVVGRTPIGRVTVVLLEMKDTMRMDFRSQLIVEGAWPPETP